MRTDGAYILKSDMLEDGYYYTLDKNGVVQKNKYGWRQKVYEILKYGTTNHISYSYIRFVSSEKENTNKIDIYTGNMSSEFTDLLKSLRYMNPAEKKPYRIENEIIYVKMMRGEENKVVISKNEEEARLYYIDEYEKTEVMRIYKFYQFGY